MPKTLLPFYLGERDDAAYAVKATCWRVSTSYLHAWLCTALRQN
jgi:hypothetical protein